MSQAIEVAVSTKDAALLEVALRLYAASTMGDEKRACLSLANDLAIRMQEDDTVRSFDDPEQRDEPQAA